jgi:Tol biopolymer transport system component
VIRFIFAPSGVCVICGRELRISSVFVFNTAASVRPKVRSLASIVKRRCAQNRAKARNGAVLRVSAREYILIWMANRLPRGAGPVSVPQSNSPEGRLESWKEIANYFGRSLRTVQEWERREGMPVHRLQHSKSGSVFAFRSELDKWQAQRTVTGQAAGIPVLRPASQPPGHGTGEEIAPQDEARPSKRWIFVVLATATAVGLTFVRWSPNRTPRQTADYMQITNFTDSAVSPALGPDGRMLAFMRGPSWWDNSGPIYVKLLPKGDPVQVTHDSRPKYGLAFSPDGSRIAYTVHSVDVNSTVPWTAYTVSPLGGEPTKLLSNAAGLTWLDERHVLFSEIKTGLHMGVVIATENRSEYRQIYFPRNERGMVHLSYASPDHKWALAVEMDPVWQPCRVIPLDGSSQGWQVGPTGRCTSAAWSPDGNWMYLGVEVNGGRHLWRQRFPAGKPEQITSGPTEEEGVAMAPDGRSLITSIGMRQQEVWIHDARGERQLSSQGSLPDSEEVAGFSYTPTFSRDGKSLFYLRREAPGGATELWRADLELEKSAKVVPGFSILEYDISTDGREVVFSAQSGQTLQIWLATMDQSAPPQLVSTSAGDSPHFGPDGEILFRLAEGDAHYLARMNRDGSGWSKVVTYPIGNVEYISPDRRWVTTISPLADGSGGVLAVPTAGGLRAPSLRKAGRLYGVPTESFSTSMFVRNRKQQLFRCLQERRCPNCRRQVSAGWTT